MKKSTFFLIAIIYGSCSYGIFFKDNKEDIEYYENLTNNLQKKERFSQKSGHHFFRNVDLFVLLSQCDPACPRIPKGSPLHWKIACLIRVNELDNIIKDLTTADPDDHRILDLQYLKQWAIGRKALKELKRY